MNFYPEHLNAAWGFVQRGSRAAGVDGITVDLFSAVAPEQIQQLHRQLQREHYAASPAKGFYLPKQSGGQRLIGIGTVRDRIVQRYLLQAIYPALEANFNDSCHAYRPGYSIYTAVEQVMERYRHQPTWVVKADIRQFFDHLSWSLLLTQLEQLQVEPVLMRLIEQQLKAGVVLQGYFCRTYQGVLQGGVLSGALANLYLREFDRHCFEAGIYLVRYGDDCVAVCGGWIEANRVLGLMGDWLEDCFLTLNAEKTKVLAPDEAFTFLGHQFCAGQVRSPERPARASPDSSKSAKPIRLGYGPPKACSIVKFTDSRPTTPSHTYWSDSMTTLYVTDQGAYLRVQHQQFQVFHGQALKCSVPVNRVSHVVLFGCCNLSHGVVSLALRRRIPILYLASNGRYFGRLETEGQAQIDYLTQQVQRSLDPEFTCRQARSLITGKLHNCRTLDLLHESANKG